MTLWLGTIDPMLTVERSELRLHSSHSHPRTEFALEEAREIVLEGKTIPYREVDSHDIVGTSQAILDAFRTPEFPRTYQAFEDQFREWNRQVIFARVAKNPGQFKSLANRAGGTIFVAPDRVVGTLRRALKKSWRPLTASVVHWVHLGIRCRTKGVLPLTTCWTG